MYGKVMSITDGLIMPYFELLTDVPDEELKEMKQQIESQSVNPMLLKKRLAREIVAQFHSVEEANGGGRALRQRGSVRCHARCSAGVPAGQGCHGSS